MFQAFNLNPSMKNIHDCVIRAIAFITKETWADIYLRLCMIGFDLRLMPDSDRTWQTYLISNGFIKYAAPNDCPDCITIRDYVNAHDQGDYILVAEGHMVAVSDGVYYDTFDTGDYIVNTIWMKGRYTDYE